MKDAVELIRRGVIVIELLVRSLSVIAQPSATNDADSSTDYFGMPIALDRPDSIVAPASITAEAGCKRSI